MEYIENQFRTALDRWPTDNKRRNQNAQKFLSAKSADDLQQWCDHWLSPEVWQRLKTAVMVRRKRLKDPKVRKIIELDTEAWQRIRDLATRDGISYSEVIKKYLNG